MNQQWWFAGQIDKSPIPRGVIVPWDGSGATPAGWEYWRLGGNRLLMGADRAGQTADPLFQVETGIENLHIGTPFQAVGTIQGGAGFPRRLDPMGAHSHTANINYIPSALRQQLIKCNVGQETFPTETGIMTAADLSEDDTIEDVTANGFTLASSTGATEQADADTTTGTSTNVPNHQHQTVGDGRAMRPGLQRENIPNGAHNHTAQITLPSTVQDNIRRLQLGMWRDSERARAPFQHMFALWESPVPPFGWHICNGQNGTPDLRNRFIGFTTNVLDRGELTGDGSIVIPRIDFLPDGAHHHRGAWDLRVSTAPTFHSEDNTHGHNILAHSVENYIPPHYTIIFIRKA